MRGEDTRALAQLENGPVLMHGTILSPFPSKFLKALLLTLVPATTSSLGIPYFLRPAHAFLTMRRFSVISLNIQHFMTHEMTGTLQPRRQGKIREAT